MASYLPATSDGVTKKAYEESILREAVKSSFVYKFMSKKGDMPILVNEKFEKGKGDAVTISMIKRLDGDPITSTGTVEGNEQSIVPYTDTITLEEYNYAVRFNNKLGLQRPAWMPNTVSKEMLMRQVSEHIDKQCITELQNTNTKYFYGGDATSVATLETGDKVTPQLLSKIATWCVTGGNRTQPPIEPCVINNRKCFIFLTYPDALYDFLYDSTWNQYLREASARSYQENPLFKHVDFVFNAGPADVIFLTSEFINIYTNGGAGSDVPYVSSVFMGKQALGWAWGQRGSLTEELFDYGREKGINYNMIHGVTKLQFNSADWGCVGVRHARTNIAGA